MTLTKSDLGQIKNIVEGALDNQEQKYEAKLTEVKSEFFEKIDPILKEVVASREERVLIEERVEKLEEIHPEILSQPSL